MVAVFIFVPWEIGHSTCPNLGANESSCYEPLLLGCERAANSCLTDQYVLDYTVSVKNLIRNRSTVDLLILVSALRLFVHDFLVSTLYHPYFYRMEFRVPAGWKTRFLFTDTTNLLCYAGEQRMIFTTISVWHTS